SWRGGGRSFVGAVAVDVESGVQPRCRGCARPPCPEYAMDMEIIDHERRRRRLESGKQLHQGLVRAAQNVAQANAAVTSAHLRREAFGAADQSAHGGGKFLDAALQISRSDGVAGTIQRDL